MSFKNRVSIILPFFNPQESFLREAVNSVLCQTYKNWELILVDDGSTNASTRLAISVASSYPDQVHYTTHQNHRNLGTSASRNRGFSQSTGELIAYLDADDIWLPQKLAEQVAIMEKYPQAGMVYGRELYWHSWESPPKLGQNDFHPANQVTTDVLMPPGAILPLWLRGIASNPCPSSIIVRRELIEPDGGFVTSFTDLYDDQAFGAKLSLASSVFISAQCWTWYRQHPASLCHQANHRSQVQARKNFLNWLLTYLHSQKIDDNATYRAVFQQLWLLSDDGARHWGGRFIKKSLIGLENRILPAHISMRIRKKSRGGGE